MHSARAKVTSVTLSSRRARWEDERGSRGCRPAANERYGNASTGVFLITDQTPKMTIYLPLDRGG